jgi:hydroxyacylglutathione hydrolase
MGLYVRQLELGPMQNFVYLVGLEGSVETAVIDPAWDVPALVEAAAADGRRITHALVTHRHFDHSNGIVPLLEQLDAKIVVHRDDAAHVAGDVPDSVLTKVTGGEQLDVGGLKISCIHTPGHTPGSQCFHLDVPGGALVSGDTVFVNACGRCDFEGGSAEQMYDSLERVLGRLPDSTTLYPGHDYGDVKVSSLGRERERNPYFAFTNPADFRAFRMRPRK